ncbi:nuclear transport factor 2 family protein [Sorangium sp. So ce124]|uniref:nuclear transport factor 2 family protein n=1 Tax=Sorangium sp. So ce124 TaxID=3133280 RepID=UPI003F608D5A
MKRWLALGLIAAGAVLGAAALLLSPSEEERIRERLAQLEDAVRIDEGERNPLVRHGRIRGEFAEIFAKEASARIAEIGDSLRGRDELANAATQAAVVYQTADVSLGGTEIQIDPAGMTAEVTATATVTGARHGQEVRRDELPVALRLEKIDGEWKIVSATVHPRQAPGDEGR